MSDDQNSKSGGWFGNPLPIMMVVLLAAGVLVKNVPLESARPTDSERVKFAAASQQDVEARLWQDPFAAVEKRDKSPIQAAAPTEKASPDPRPPDRLHSRITDQHGKMTVVAVSVFGGPYAEDAENRRRSRFAVISALGFHEYHPENAEVLGYFHATKPYDDDVPYEWFEGGDKSRPVLVLWLKDEKLTAAPLATLRDLFSKLTPDSHEGLTVKFIGPAGSGTLRDLVREGPSPNQNSITLRSGNVIEFYSPSATISNCDLLYQEEGEAKRDCVKDPPSSLLDRTTLPIVRTIGSDDVLADSLLWELWQRGVNRELGYVDSWWTRKFGKGTDTRKCDDGLVLISERDTEYGRTLSRYLKDGFSHRCEIKPNGKHEVLRSDKHALPPVRTFNYLRGLDGVLPDIDKSGSKAPTKGDGSKSNDLRAQLEDAPPEHAEGRSQFDYLRRLADEIERLDRDKKSFAENGVKAIGIVGSDLYDKLIILQALRSRFKDKIFFTTDLDARYLHADQNDWARNLVVASNFGLSLGPALQNSTLPFRDGYQTATYLATLMAVGGKSIKDWTDKRDKWLGPKIFEIGRTEAVHLASPSVKRLRCWKDNGYSEDSPEYSGCMKSEKPENSNGNENSEGGDSSATNKPCTSGWWTCANIEPDRIPWSLLREHPWAISTMVCF
ncbi:MAG: hypothetical protein ABI988_13085, partial [Nitrospirota bacterium]